MEGVDECVDGPSTDPSTGLRVTKRAQGDGANPGYCLPQTAGDIKEYRVFRAVPGTIWVKIV